MARFESEPKIVVKFDGNLLLDKELIYHSDLVPHPVKIKVGARTDLASIPWFAQWVVPKFGKWNAAAIVHDYIYEQGLYNKEIADKMFFEAMTILEVKFVRRWVMYFAVHKFGKGNFHDASTNRRRG